MPVLRIPLRHPAVEIGFPMTGCGVREPVLVVVRHDLSWNRVYIGGIAIRHRSGSEMLFVFRGIESSKLPFFGLHFISRYQIF